MENKLPKIILFGGNSEIGFSIVNGLIKKYNLCPDNCFFVVRNKPKKELKSFNLIYVNKYIDAVNIIKEKIDASEKIIFVVSYGILIEEEVSFNVVNYKKQIEINALDQIELISSILNFKNIKEIHIASSILADFIRPTLYSYSISKQILSKHVKYLFKNAKYLNLKIFEWKFSFVNTNLNKNRKPSFLKTNIKTIENIIVKKDLQGIYYVPSYAKPFTMLAKTFESFVVVFDKIFK